MNVYVCTYEDGWNTHTHELIGIEKKLIWTVYECMYACDIESKFLDMFDEKFDMDQNKYKYTHTETCI